MVVAGGAGKLRQVESALYQLRVSPPLVVVVVATAAAAAAADVAVVGGVGDLCAAWSAAAGVT